MLMRNKDIQYTRFIEVPIPSQESQRTCICVLGVASQRFLLFFRLDFGFWNCPDNVVFLLVHHFMINNWLLGNDHLTWRGGVMFFFLKIYSYSQCCWKKYSDIGGGKKNKYDSEFLSYNLMLNSGKKNSDSARQKK